MAGFGNIQSIGMIFMNAGAKDQTCHFRGLVADYPLWILTAQIKVFHRIVRIVFFDCQDEWLCSFMCTFARNALT